MTEKGTRKAQELKESAREWQEAATDKVQSTGRAIDDYVQENAWISVAIAAALGCAIGLLLAKVGD